MRVLVILSVLFAGCPAAPDDTVEPDTEVTETDGTEAGTDVGTEAPDPCEDLACDNGECLADGATAFCDCDDGWEGDLCDVDVNECEVSPCANEATCVNTDGSFTCDCEPGWDGDLCDLNIDDCPDADCGNGACVDGIDAFTCDCDPGWEGDACDQEIDECADAPCVNDGQCVDQLNAFTCICEDGWDGEVCDGNIDECADSSCDQGDCVDGIAAFTCECDIGFDGELCDNNIDDCDGVDACGFGDCVDSIAAFTCDCDDGWQGTFCDEDINECDAPDACTSDAVCNNTNGSFTCDPVALVDPNRASSGDGSSWSLAYASIQDAIDAGATAIWVKEGVLTPSGTNTPVLRAAEDVIILGGFSAMLEGREGSADSRDPSVRTVLSGVYGGDSRTRVVVAASGMTLDAFVIRDGSAGSGSGGGIQLVEANDVTLNNVRIEGNAAGVSGAGLYCENSVGLLVTDSVFDVNTVTASGGTAGGGIASVNCSADLVDSEVTGNRAVSARSTAQGGGLWLQGSDWVLDGVELSDNHAAGGSGVDSVVSSSPGSAAFGGGVHITGSPTAPWTDVVFVGNTATGGNGSVASPRICFPIGGCVGGGRGGAGGAALGGGLFASPATSLTLIGGSATDNVATAGLGGAAGGGSPAGADGHAEGGGLYFLGANVDSDLEGSSFEGNIPDAFRPCPAGFEGYACEDNIDDCADDPCANAECIDVIDAFICDCDPGWEGTLCDVDVDADDCTPDACTSDRVCIDAVDSFTCELPVFVSPSGDGSTGASWETAFTSLNAAFDAGATGVWMSEGTYTAGADADVWIDVPGKARVFGGFSSSLSGQAGDVALRPGVSVVDGASRVQHVVQMGRGSHIDGLQIQGGSGSRFGGGVVINNADRVVLRNSTIRANSVTGDEVRAAGVYCDRSTEVLFDDIIVEGNSATGSQIVGGGLALYTCTGSLRNSRIANNTATSDNNATGIGLALVQGVFDVSDTIFEGNVGTGGQGGTGGYGSFIPFPQNGGTGGQANGGGAYIDSVESMSWSNVDFLGNRLTGGTGGTGAATQDGANCFDAGNGGAGGAARGGGVYITPTSDVTLVSGSALNNVLVNGQGGAGGAGLTCPSRPGAVGASGALGGVGFVTGGAVFATDSATVALNPVSGNTEVQVDVSR